MNQKIAILFSMTTALIVGSLVFIFNQSIDFPTMFLAVKLIIPSAFVAYVGGYLLGIILKTAKTETQVLGSDIQKQFVDDLLISPADVLNENDYLKEDDVDLLETNKNKDEKN